jgi:hypothetical protein
MGARDLSAGLDLLEATPEELQHQTYRTGTQTQVVFDTVVIGRCSRRSSDYESLLLFLVQSRRILIGHVFHALPSVYTRS